MYGMLWHKCQTSIFFGCIAKVHHSPSESEKRVRPAVALLCLFAIGIVIDRLFSLDWLAVFGAAFLGLLVWASLYRIQKNAISVCVLAVAVIATGSFWHHGRWNWFAPREIAAFCEAKAVPVCVRGRILGEPKHAEKVDDSLFDSMPKNARTKFRFAPMHIRNGTRWEQVAGSSTLIVYADIDHIQFGDEVEVIGKLRAIGQPTSPGQFDFQNFSRSKGQLTAIHVMYPDAVTITKRAARFSNAALLSTTRQYLDCLIQTHVGSGQAGFASAVLLGNREQLSANQREKFLVTGTAHLLAISGLHVGILAGLFLVLYRFGLLPRRWALLSTIMFVLFYVWLVEFRPPVLRAAVLLILFCVGRLVGRSGSEFNLIALAGVVVLIINPMDLFQLGPQLSFLAFATLVVFKDWIFPPQSQDPIDRLIWKSRSKAKRMLDYFGKVIGQMVLVSTLIWLIGLPLVAANFHLVTPAAILVNPLVVFPLAFALFAGLGVCVFGGTFPFIADFFGWICGVCLRLVSTTIQDASEISGAYWWTSGPTTISLLAFYSLLCAVVLFLPKRKERTIIVAWLILIVCSWMFPFQLDKFLDRHFQREARCTYLDVGHGSSVLIETSGGQTMLYDAGSLTSERFAANTVSNLLWSNQIEHIDAIVISHADLDHFNAIPTLVKRFSVGVVYVGLPMTESSSESVGELFAILSNHGIPIRTLTRDDRVVMDGESNMKVLLPPEFGTGGGDNSNSVVLQLELSGYRTLLPGDLEKSGMLILLKQKRLDCDIVMMPHHGSKNSQPVDFLKWSTPESAIVCASASKVDANVIEQIEASDCNALTTAELGTVQVHFADDRIRFAHWKNGNWQEIK